MALHVVGNTLVGLAVLASCICIVEAATNKNERELTRNTEESSHESDGAQRSHWGRRLISVTSKKNELGTGSDRKTMHRLIGGHLKSLSRQQGEKEAYDGGAWDDGLLLSSAGNGKEKKNNSRTEDDDEKKTLAQQVKEGKYGLIQNEIYPEKPKRPGIISYLNNPEVPKDTAQNLGGLDEEEIWLAENHVLVLRGGNFPGQGTSHQANSRQKWTPIDNYEAPKRQVKIPSRPKIPPPFPVQLTEGGPIKILQTNTTHASDNDANKYDTNSYYSEGFLPGEGPFFPLSVNGTIPPYLGDWGNFTNGDNVFPYTQNITDGALGPFYHALPPGAVFLPPPNNQTDYDDDDDQSIYYPPRYTFYYPEDNNSAVPPGPLVPGIILPPPPDFFSAFEEETTVSTASPTTLPTTTSKIQTAAAKEKYTRRPNTTPHYPKTHPTYLPPRKISTKPYKSYAGTSTTMSTKLNNRTKHKNATNILTSTPEAYYKTTSYEEGTTLPPKKLANIVNVEYYSVRPLLGNQVTESSASGKSQWSATVSSTSVPLLAYYATTPSPLDVTPTSIKDVIPSTRAVQPNQFPNQASYYFYEETSDEISGTAGTTSTTGTDATATVTAPPPIYYRTTTTPSPYYKVEPLPLPLPLPLPPSQNNKQYYNIESVPSQETTKDYNSKLINSLAKEAHVYQYSDSGVVLNPNEGNVKSGQPQRQRVLAESAPIYYQTISIRPSVAPKPKPYYYSNLQKPSYNYEIKTSNNPTPVYQYSYEAAEYRKQKQEQPYYQSQTSIPQSQRDQISYNEYQDIQRPDEHYDYDGSEPVPTQRLQPQRVAYDTPRKIAGYSTTTLRPVVKATPNPSHAYFTKQDERLLDDVTKEYFNIFGKKLPEGNNLVSTTPIYASLSSTTEKPRYQNENTYVANDYEGHQTALYKHTAKVKVHYNDQTQRPYSLEDDTLINYKHPLPPINPDSEFISVSKPETSEQSQSYKIAQIVQPTNRPYKSQNIIQEAPNEPTAFVGPRIVKEQRPRGYAIQETSHPNSGNKRPAPVRKYQQQNNWPENRYVPSNFPEESAEVDYPSLPISLADDIAVNYRHPRPNINPDAEFIGPITGGQVTQIGQVEQGRQENKENAYFAYQLPGNGGGHFYFLTPQAVSQKQDENGGYLYPKPRGPRLLRRRRGPSNL